MDICCQQAKKDYIYEHVNASSEYAPGTLMTPTTCGARKWAFAVNKQGKALYTFLIFI